MRHYVWIAPFILMTAGCGNGKSDASAQATDPPSTESIPATTQEVEAKWVQLEDACSGAVDRNSPEAVKACTDRDSFDRKLTEGGWCHGTDLQAEYEKRWHPCPVQRQSPAMLAFEVRAKDKFYSNEWDGTGTVRSYFLTNTGQTVANIKWVAINNRDDCFAVPVLYGKKVESLKVMDSNDTDSIADFVMLQVGQSINLDMEGTSCGQLVRLKIGTDVGDIDIGPLTFL